MEMEGKYGYFYSKDGLLSIMMRNNGDFEEQDVWDLNDTKGNQNHDETELPKNPSARHLTSSPETNVPTPQNGNTKDPKSTQSEAWEKMILHEKSSAPIKIATNPGKMKPNKGYFSKNVSWSEDGDCDDDVNAKRYPCDEEDDDDGFDFMLPPHEIIAKRLARSHIPTFSVFEGVGRTLKGRDLRKVRDAVLVKTGFLEPPQ